MTWANLALWATAASAGMPGEEALDDARRLLDAGSYAEAAAIAAEGRVAWPDLAVSFSAVEQRALVALREPPPPREGAPPSLGARVPPMYAVPPSTLRRAAVGFEAGLPAGFRAEWSIERIGIDEVGARFGGNLLGYNGVWPVSSFAAFVDWRLRGPWQAEISVGGVSYFGWVYPMVGAAGQWDPEGPLFVQAGAQWTSHGAVLPDVGAGFVW